MSYYGCVADTYQAQRVGHELSHSPCLLLQANAAEEMVWYTFHLFLGDLIGDDREALVKLHRISIDHLTVELSSDLDSQLPLFNQ